jgi:hypothetical protein
MVFSTDGTTRFTIAGTGAATFSSSVTANGNINQINASSVIASNKFSTYDAGVTDMNFAFPSAGSVTFTDGTQRFRIYEGNVSIGNPSVATKLSVAGNIYAEQISSNVFFFLKRQDTNTNFEISTENTQTRFKSWATSNDRDFFFDSDNSGTTRMVIKGSNGNVWIGANSESGDRLRVTGGNGTTFTDAIVTMRPSSTTVKSDVWKLGRAALATSAEPEDIWVRVQIGTKNYDLLAIDRGTA